MLHAIRYSVHDDDTDSKRRDGLLELDAAIHCDEDIVVATHAVQELAVPDASPPAADHGVDIVAGEFSGEVYG